MPDIPQSVPAAGRTTFGTPPAGAPPSSILTAADVNAILTALAQVRAVLTASAAALTFTNDARLTDARAPTAHGHTIAAIAGLQTALDAASTRADTAVVGVGTTAGAYPARPAHPGVVLWTDPDVDPGVKALTRDVWLRRATGA